MRDTVEDLAPRLCPAGRVTVEVCSERTGRVKHRQVGENATMDWIIDALREAMQVSLAGTNDQGTSNAQPFYSGPLNQVWGNIVDSPKRYDRLVAGFAPIPNALQLVHASNALLLTDGTDPIDTSLPWHSGDIVAASSTRADTVYANTKLGIPDFAATVVEPNFQRYVFEFGPTKGNGTFQTAGFGRVAPDLRAAGSNGVSGFPVVEMEFQASSPETVAFPTPIGYSAGWGTSSVALQTVFHEIQQFMMSTSSISYSETRQFPAETQTTMGGGTPLLTGTPTTARGLAVIGNTLWLLAGTNVWRTLALPTTGTAPALSGSGTFTGFTDDSILGVASDGTLIYVLGQTRVFVFDPATQTITSSWLHNVPGISSLTTWEGTGIGYDRSRDLLHITQPDSGIEVAFGTGFVGTTRTTRIHLVQPDGTHIGRTYEIPAVTSVNSTTTGQQQGVICGMLPNGKPITSQRFGSAGTNYRTPICSGHMRSAVLLDDPVVKTSDDTMRVTYELDFAA